MIRGRKRVAPFRPALGKAGADGSMRGWEGDVEVVMPRGEEAGGATTRGMMKARKHKLVILFLFQLAVFLCMWLAARLAAGALYPGEDFLSFRLVVPLVIFFLSYCLMAWWSVYSRDYHYYLRRAHGTVLKNGLFPMALACLASLVLGTWKSDPFPMVLAFFAAGFMSFAVADGCQHLWIRYLSRLGYFRKKILVISRRGLPLAVDSRLRDFGSTKIYAGEIDRTNGVWMWRPAGGGTAKVVKGFPQLRTIILRENIGDILLFPGAVSDRAFERELVEYCQSQSISYTVVPERAGSIQTGIASLLFPNIPMSERFAGSRDSLTAISTKRLLDIAISLVCLALFLPAWVVICLAILFQDGFPVLYVSTRIGKNGSPIRFFKFRSMVRDADREKERLLAFNARADGPLFKMRNDPRVTPVGALLRRYSLDEFPQFLNVLLGTMSLVGPRPHLPQEVAQYGDGDYLRLECMPGIVGLPQVSGRNTTIGFREWVDLDLAYRRQWSLALDLGIMGKTIRQFIEGLVSGPDAGHY